jgi:FtsH-binding integral membrane protein
MNENTASNAPEPKAEKTWQLSRKWVTPFTLGAFALSAFTGILLFFKVHIGLIKPTHEWLSWLLVIAAVFHLLLNYRPMMKRLAHPVGKTLMVVFALLIGISLLPFWDPKDHGRNHGNQSAYSGEPHHGRDH